MTSLFIQANIRHNLLRGKQPAETVSASAIVGQEIYDIWHRPAKGNSAERFYSLSGVRCESRTAAGINTKAEGHRPSRA